MPHRDEMTDPLEAELAPLLAAEKPVPRPEFVRELDARVAARFPRRRRSWRVALWRPQLAVAAGALAAAVIAIVVVTGSDSGGGGNAKTALLDQRAPAAKPAAPSAGAASSAQSEAVPRTAAPVVPGGVMRRVERSTDLVLSVRRGRIQDAAQRVFGIVTAAGGVVQSSNVASGAGAGATFDLRIPASRVTRTVGELARLGHVRSETNSTLDVTKAYTSLGARLADARAERSSLLRRLAKATTANETASIKAQLRLVEARIGALERSQRQLRNRTDYARVSLELVPEHGSIVAPPHHHRLTPGRALHDAGHVLAVAASVALLALAVALPVGVVALLAWLAARPLVRRRREHALDTA